MNLQIIEATRPDNSGTARRRSSVGRVRQGQLAVVLLSVCTQARFIEAVRKEGRAGRPAPSLSRCAAVYLGHTLYELNFTALGRVFGLDRTTARRFCGKVEDRRDEPGFEAALGAIERSVAAWSGAFEMGEARPTTVVRRPARA